MLLAILTMILAVFVNSCIYNVDLLAPLSAPIQGAFMTMWDVLGMRHAWLTAPIMV